MKSQILLIPLTLGSLLFAGCSNGNQQNTETANMANQSQAKASKTGKAEFSFDETTKDLGKIAKGETVVKGFIFENTGKEPLVISDASASCGCTVPEYSQDPIPPGETGFVDVAFDSDGKSAKDFSQTVTLKANTPSGKQQLKIVGTIKGDNQKQQVRQPNTRKSGQSIQLGQGGNQAKPASGQGKDKFGRSPDHPHYQHDHPPQNQQRQQQGGQQQIQPQGQQGGDNQGTDKHGRPPGHPHYQHDHPPQNQEQQNQQQRQVQPQGQQGDNNQGTDKHGRSPDHPHYQHDHPPQNQQRQQQGGQQQIQPQGRQDGNNQGTDKHGRSPGHPHYQHDHPPQNQQQKQGNQSGEIELKQKDVKEGEKDKHGRGPDHPHYRHNHPPKDDNQEDQ